LPFTSLYGADGGARIGRIAPAALAVFAVAVTPQPTHAAFVEGDPLEVAIAAPNEALTLENSFGIFGSETLIFDDNVYRLSSDVTDLRALNGISPDAARSDRINTTSAGLDGVWNRGRQTFTLDLNADDNRFDRNSNLDNISSADKAVWRYDVGGVLSGQVGAVYNRALISFGNINRYDRDLYAATSYFGAGRYQLGPRWAIFGGVLESGTTLSDMALQSNDSHQKSVDFGTEYATGVKDSLGVEYRYTDARYPRGSALNDDYREEVARFIIRHAFSEKTDIDASGGLLKREYANEVINSFSGDVWRVAAHWQATDKVQVEADGWRNPQAYITAQSDYYISTGGRIAPHWTPTQKITLAVSLSYEAQNYIGVTESELSQGSRRDKLTTSQLTLTYAPIEYLAFDFAYAYQKRDSNESQFTFNDNIVTAKVTVKR
jgi:hypothetical protein